MTPFLVSAMTGGSAAGLLAASYGLSGGDLVFMAVVLNSGSLQFLLMRLQLEGASIFTILSAALMVSLRLAFYSVELRKHVRGLPRSVRALLGYALIDAAFFIIKERSEQAEKQRTYNVSWFLWGACSAMLSVWTIGSLVGASLSKVADNRLLAVLDFPSIAIFVTLLIGGIKSLSHLMTALASGGIAVVLYDTYGSLMIAACAGAFSGVIISNLQEKTSSGHRCDDGP